MSNPQQQRYLAGIAGPPIAVSRLPLLNFGGSIENNKEEIMISPRSGYASDNKSCATFSSLNQVRIEWLRPTVLSGRLNDT